MIYFISDGAAIKIGRSRDVKARLKDLNCGNARPLSLIASIEGHSKHEAAIHADLAEYRLHGEWFEDCTAVREALTKYEADGVRPAFKKTPRAYRRLAREIPDIDVRLMEIDLFRLPMAEARSAYLKNACGALEAILSDIKHRKGLGLDISHLVSRAAQIDAVTEGFGTKDQG